MRTSNSGDDVRQIKLDTSSQAWGFSWRSHPLFAIFTIGIGVFTDSFLFDLIAPILPFLLGDNIGIPPEKHQFYVSQILSTFALANVILSPLAGMLTDRMSTRKTPFLIAVGIQIVATTLLFTARTIHLLTLSRILQGACAAMIWTVGLAWCRDVVGVENLGKTTGTIFSFVSVGSVTAPVIGGSLYNKGGSNAVAALSLGLLAIDFSMRLLIIESTRNSVTESQQSQAVSSSTREPGAESNEEETPLLGHNNTVSHSASDKYLIPDNQAWIIQQIPLLVCFKSASLWVAQFMMFSQGITTGALAATIPLHARVLYEFDAMRSGFLFAPMGFANLIFGPLAGFGVDRYGTRAVSVIGYLWLVPVTALLRTPTTEPRTQQISLYCVLLGFIGIGLGLVNSAPIVESADVVQRYHDRNPDFFGPNGPYASLYGLGNLCFCLGLFVGPIWAGGLTIRVGYGNMNACLAAVSAVTALACWIWLPPKTEKLNNDAVQTGD